MVRVIAATAVLALAVVGHASADSKESARGTSVLGAPLEPDGPAGPGAVAEPTGVLHRAAARAAALAGNPALRASAWDVMGGAAHVDSAGRRPDPEIGVYAENVTGSGPYADAGQAQVTLEMRQLVELGGKRGARVAVAERALGVASVDHAIRRLDVEAEVERRFVRLLAAQEGIALATAEERRAEAIVGATRRRVAAGAGSSVEEERAAMTLARTRIATEHADHQLAVARRELAASWGAPEARFERAAGDLFERRDVPSFEVLAARVIDAPDAARLAAERRLRDAEALLVAARRVPDLTIGGGVRRVESPAGESLVFTIGIPLPFSNRSAGPLAEAQAAIGRSEAVRDARAIHAGTELFALYQELLHAGIELAALEDEILPGSERAVRAARRGFEAGLYSYLELAEAERARADALRDHVAVAASYQQHVVDIERAIGGPVAGAQEDGR